VTYFYNLGTRSICRKLFKLESTNLARTLTIRSADDKNSKIGERGSGTGGVT